MTRHLHSGDRYCILGSMTRKNELIEVCSEIKDCKARLRKLESRFEELIVELGGGSPAAGTSTNGRRRSSYGYAILAIVDADPQQEFSEDKLLESAEIAEEKKASFRSALSRLVGDQAIIRIGPKLYRSKLYVDAARDTETLGSPGSDEEPMNT